MAVVNIKNQKAQKSVSQKEHINLKIIKAIQLDNKINYLAKNTIYIDCFFCYKKT